MQRCYSKKNHSYHQYGGRGIKVCKRWHSLPLFIKDNDTTFNPALTIDRINNNKDYTPQNVRWATRQQQAFNRRSNILITFKGETKPMFQWAYDIGIRPETVWARFNRNWSVERALTQPIKS